MTDPQQSITSAMISRFPDQTARWLNTLKQKIESLSSVDPNTVNQIPDILVTISDLEELIENNADSILNLQDDKLAINTTDRTVYAVGPAGEQIMIPYSNGADPNSIPIYEPNGTLNAFDPIFPTNVTTKNYVDTALDRFVVTSSDVDFSTFGNITGIPQKTITQSMGYSLTASLTRIGNLVFCYMNSTSSSLSNLDGASIAEIITIGYRPAVAAVFDASWTQGGNNANVGWTISTTGVMTMTHAGASTGNNRFHGSGMWWTNNAFPI